MYYHVAVVGQTCGSSWPGEILTSLPPGSCLASEELDGETWFLYRDGDVAILLSPVGKAILFVESVEGLEPMNDSALREVAHAEDWAKQRAAPSSI